MSFFVPFLFSFFACLLLVPLTILVAKKYGFVDNPKKHMHPAIIHSKTLPRAGGLPIFLSTTLSAILFLPISQKIIGILIGGLILVTIGLIDDKYDIKSRYKLAAQVLAAIIVVAGGIGISFLPNPLSALNGQGYEVLRLDTLRIAFDFMGRHSVLLLADLIAVFWIVWVINMVNFSSGVDGQMPGIVFVVMMVIFASTLRFIGSDPSQVIVSNLALIGAGATLGFLVFNFYPAKIFPGDSGSYFLGFLVATCAILSGAKMGTAILVMAVPLTDGVFTIIRRTLTGSSPFTGDKKHLHHRLLEVGFSQRQITLFYCLACAILGAAALWLHAIEKLFAGLVVLVIILGVLVWLNMNLSQKLRR